MTRPFMPGWKRAMARCLLVTGSLAMALLVAEGTVRTRQYVKYGTFHEIGGFRRADETTHLEVPVPGSATATIRINSRGFRSPELDWTKPGGRIRIAFVGASTTFCAEVSSNEATWPYLVWRAMQEEHPENGFDYLNAGIPGYTVANSLRNLERRVAPLAPDVIVLYEGFNDFIYSTQRLASERGLYEKRRDIWSGRWSLALDLVRKNYEILVATWQMRRGARPVLRFEPDEITGGFRADLTALVAASRRLAPVVAIATLSHRIRRDQTAEEQLAASEAALFYMPFLDPNGLVKGYEAYNRVIREIARSSGLILIEGEDTIPGDSAHFHDSVHFADAGSALQAHRVILALDRSPAFVDLLKLKLTRI
ncbi:MAG: hypothetical protein HYS05_18045 [Acidobacteria bacterium]|nr:hypothetical protein [Acidobacteriota bacterium]